MDKVDVRENGEYPILLGDSLKTSQSPLKFLQLRYNWQPAEGFPSQRGTLKRGPGGVRLAYQDDGSPPATYGYNGFTPTNNDISRMALVFDEAKSAFVLEKISNALDLNLKSGPNLSSEEIQKHPQLKKTAASSAPAPPPPSQQAVSDDEGEADQSNPYDFRHFLAEAKESAERNSQPTGNRTPIPGSRTPLSGAPSPSIGAGRANGSSSFQPAVTSNPLLKKSAAATKAAVRKTPGRRKDVLASKPSKPLSKERISDSDEELSDTITVKAPSQKSTRPVQKATSGAHARNMSATSQSSMARHQSPLASPATGRRSAFKQQQEEDEDGEAGSGNEDFGLEIDEGSPPPSPKRKQRIDPDAFRPGTGTPDLFRSSTTSSSRRQQGSQPPSKSRTRTSDPDSDVEAMYLEHSSPPVAASHRSKPAAASKTTSHSNNNNNNSEDDDLLAAELEAALEEEEESEVSEEE